MNSNKQIIVSKYRKAISLYDQTMGLMFKDKLDQPLLFSFQTEDYVPVHMFFVKFPINVYYLNSNYKVVERVLHLKPWKVHIPKTKCKYILETSPLDIACVGDTIELTTNSNIRQKE